MGSLQLFCGKRLRSKEVNLNHLLPHEVLSDILSRLPLTSLPQVKLTCKLWYSLVVADPSFPGRHLTQALKNPGYLYTLMRCRNFHFAENKLDNTTVEVAAIRLPKQVENNDLGEDTLYNNPINRAYVEEYASCHGLVCHCSLVARSIFVFNPMISEHVQLPDRPFPSILRWGFGFAPICKKYKCYCFSFRKAEGDKERVYSSAVYTLGDQSWREISFPPFPTSLSICREHVCCKGVLYWAIRKLRENGFTKFEDGYDVVSLDLETETFRKRRVDFPLKTGSFSLTVVGDNVAAVLRFSHGHEVLFLIDEDKDIWERKYTLPKRIPVKYKYQLELLGLWMNQDLFLWEHIANTTTRCFEVKCFFFRPGEDKFIAFHFPFAKDARGEQIRPQLIIPHVGSLVSPIKIMKTGKQQFSTLSG